MIRNCLKDSCINFLDGLSNVKSPKINIDDSILLPYYNRFLDSYRKLDSVTIDNKQVNNLNNNRDHGVPCNTLQIIFFLNKHQRLLDEMFSLYKFSEEEQKATKDFIYMMVKKMQDNYKQTNNYNSKSNSKFCSEWFNHKGTKLSRGIYNLLKMNKIPDYFKRKMNIISDEIYGEFGSTDVRENIENYINAYEKYNIEFRGTNLNLKIFTRSGIPEDELKKIVKRCFILSLFEENPKQIHIEFIGTDNVKRLPPKTSDKLLGPREINSGSTSFGIVNEISIWREEECKKLIIHELIHYLDLDFRTMNNQIYRDFNIAPDIEIRLYEAYTEVWANVINCFTCVFECCAKYDSTANFKKVKECLMYERKFACFQVAKILNHFGFTNIAEFLKPYDGDNKFKQTTSVFSYFFVKGLLLFNLDKLINLMVSVQNKTHHINSKTNLRVSIKFPDSYENMIKFYNLILDLCYQDKKKHIINHDSLFLKLVQYNLNYIRNKNNLRSKFFSSLRMTCIEV